MRGVASKPATASLDPVLESAEVIVCCGSGGVGKTTTAAVIGLEAARAGRRAVVVTIDPARRLADALGLADGLAPEPQRIRLDDVLGAEGTGELWAMMLDTAAAFDALVRRTAASEGQAQRILDNPFYRNISGALSGTQEYMAAETLHQLHGDERFDIVVVDTPPSRNALDFLEAPGVLARFLDHRVFRLLMLPARRGMSLVSAATQPLLRAIGRVVGSDVLADAVAFFQAFAGMEAGFRQRAEDVIRLLRSDATRYVIVASPHRDTVTEAVWFAEQLAGQGIDRIAGVANRVHPSFGPGTMAEAEAHAASADPRRGRGAVAQRGRAAGAGRGGARRVGAVRRTARWRAARGGAAAVGRRARSRRAERDPPPPVRRPVTATGTFRDVKVLLATDADWLVEEIVAAVGGVDVTFTVTSEGRDVARLVEEREQFDIGIFDLQIGSMGGMAVTMALRLDASSGRFPHVPVLMLLDRVADVHLARRSGAEGWIVKPLDPLRLRRAVRAVVEGGAYHEGLLPPEVLTAAEDAPPQAVDAVEPAAGRSAGLIPERPR